MPFGTETYGGAPFYGSTPTPPAPPTFPDVAVEIAFQYTPQSSTIGWTNVTPYVEAVRCRAGRVRELERFTAGTSTVVAETRFGRLDPVDTGSAYDGFLLPRTPIRCVATWDGVDYPVFSHFVEDFDVSYDETPTVAIPAADWFAVLADKKLADSPYALLVRDAAPKAWWRLGDKRNEASTTVAGDSSTTGAHAGVYQSNSGQITFGAEVSPWDSARGIELDGGSWVAAPASAAVTGQFTIEGTFRTDHSEFDAYQDMDSLGLFSQGNRFVYNSDGVTYESTKGIHVSLYRDTSGGIQARYGGATLNSSATGYYDGDPHLFRLEWNGTTLSMYLDGALSASTTVVPDTATKPSAPIVIGRASSTYGAYWIGGLQDFQIYDSALGAADFATRYEAWKHGHAGETSGDRIGRILDFADVPANRRAIDDGNSTLAGTRLGRGALEETHLVNDTEDGLLFVSGDGKVTFKERHARLFAPYTTSQATFYDDDPSNGPDDLMYETVDPARPLDAIRNRVELTPEGGDEQIGVNAASVAAYGEKPYTKATLHDSTNAARDAVNWILARYANPASRFRKMTLTPYGQEALMWPQLLGRKIGDRITVVRRLLSGDTLTQDCHIEGIEHDFDAYGRWVTTWMLSPADTTTWWVLGDATLGVLGSTARVAY